MNKAITIITVAAASLLSFSCNRDCIEFRGFTMDDAFALAEGMQDSVKISMEIEYPEHTGSKAGHKIASAITGAMFGNTYENMSIEEAAGAWTDSLVKEYRETNLELIEILRKDGDEGPFTSMFWEYVKSGSVSGRHKDILSYHTVSYSFTGGAHGATMETFLNFDTKTGCTVKQEDIFTDGFEEPVGDLLMKHLNDGRQDFPVVLFTDSIMPNGNFMITPEGITFTFNQYEIAAYSFGVIDIFIPADEIKPYLKEEIELYD